MCMGTFGVRAKLKALNAENHYQQDSINENFLRSQVDVVLAVRGFARRERYP